MEPVANNGVSVNSVFNLLRSFVESRDFTLKNSYVEIDGKRFYAGNIPTAYDAILEFLGYSREGVTEFCVGVEYLADRDGVGERALLMLHGRINNGKAVVESVSYSGRNKARELYEYVMSSLGYKARVKLPGAGALI